MNLNSVVKPVIITVVSLFVWEKLIRPRIG